MEIVVYRITGPQGWFRVPDFVCRECDLTVEAVRQACAQAGVELDRLTIKPWLPHLRQAWREGARHPPVVLVNGRVYSQEQVPDPHALAQYLQQEQEPEDRL